MFTPLILTALLPLNPAHFLRELVCWFIGIFLDTLDNPETRAWIKANPKDRSVRLDLLGSLVMIEDMICALTHIRARQMLGHKPRGRRKGRRPSYTLTGHPPTLEEIERRFQRALQRLDAVEKHSASLMVKIARLLTDAMSPLERVHHPATTTTSACIPPTTTIPLATISASACALVRIRAPPWSDSTRKTTPAQPAGLTCENANPCPFDRQPLKFSRSPGSRQRAFASLPLPDRVTHASRMSLPPKQMLVV